MSAPLLLVLCVAASATGETPSPREVGVRRAVSYLASSQHPDGSWGGPGILPGWSDPTEHENFRVSCTALACLALMGHRDVQGAPALLPRGLDYLLVHVRTGRSTFWGGTHILGWIYGLQALIRAERMHFLPHERVAPLARDLIRHIANSQSPGGGWLYFDGTYEVHPEWTSSWGGAIGLMALLDAREAGYEVPEATLMAARNALRAARLPSGATLYYVRPSGSPYDFANDSRGPAEDVPGSIGRTQVCNLARFQAGDVGTEELLGGIALFFRHRKFLEVARCKGDNHACYYWVGGWFFLFGHGYAGQVIQKLPLEVRARYRCQLEEVLLAVQNPDGSWWDYPKDGYAGYTKAYGTAYALMGLAP